jgi:NAD(P)H-hydrate epimerase
MASKLITAAASQHMDARAVSEWSFNHFALVEAAGRSAAREMVNAYPCLSEGPFTVVLAGSGNNAADAMVILRTLILWEKLSADDAMLLITKIPDLVERSSLVEQSPWADAYRSLKKMGVPHVILSAVDDTCLDGMLGKARFIIDGITGTGLSGPLRGDSGRLVEKLNSLETRAPVVSVDVPSGLFDEWKAGMPLVKADAVLAIEPAKLCLYKPSARPFCGRIIPVQGIFPAGLIAQCREAELVDWDHGQTLMPPAAADSYKYSRGLAEIRAGASGSVGAARIAARGAQAAGAGLVRLLVDPAIHPILAAGASGIMVDCEGDPGASRFKADAILLGPGWGRGPERQASLEEALGREAGGTPLVLDADGIFLAKDAVFHGNALLSPHPGELAAYSGIPKEELLDNPVPHLRALAGEKKAVILFKSHVMLIASPDGRVGVVDGMKAVLAAGGTGDLLAGICAGIAARGFSGAGCRDLYACAMAGASLLIRIAEDPRIAGRFADPLEMADAAADLAGKAWLLGER